jgi:hypothetical protein
MKKEKGVKIPIQRMPVWKQESVSSMSGRTGEKEARVKKIEKPEAPEDAKGEELHLLDPFQPGTAWFLRR